MTMNIANADTIGEGMGDAGDAYPMDPNNDIDADTICGDVDNCPTTPNMTQTNSDGDALGDACDNCDFATNLDQADADMDGTGDVCDNDECDDATVIGTPPYMN